MKEPTTEAELKVLHDIRRSDPRRYLQIADGWLQENPNSADAYFGRHFAWMRLGEPHRALEDLNKALALESHPLKYIARAEIYRCLGEYQKALDDLARSQGVIAEKSEESEIALLSQAYCYARLGDEERALACCARLPSDFCEPGLDGAPDEDRFAIAEKLRRIAAEARRARG